MSKWNAVTVVGAGEVGLAGQLVEGGDDQGARVQHQQYQGHPHSQARETQTSFSSRILFSQSLKIMHDPLYFSILFMEYHPSETAGLTEI